MTSNNPMVTIHGMAAIKSMKSRKSTNSIKQLKQRLFAVFIGLSLFLPQTGNTTQPTVDQSASSSLESSFWEMEYPFASEITPQDPPSDLVVPLLSLFAPGVNQLYHKQNSAGAAYLGYYLLGRAQAQSLNSYLRGLSKAEKEKVLDVGTIDDRSRQFQVGVQMAQFAGEMSLYHSFRSAAEARKKIGEYQFFNPKETTGDLLKAPLRFDFLKRKTTWGVFAIQATLLALASIPSVTVFGAPSPPSILSQVNAKDTGYAFAFSYQAGVGEEAVFRGMFMPFMVNRGMSPFMSNLLTSTLFGAAHISKSNPVPLSQFLMGYYLGQVAIWNDWSIQESIFIHTWWDVLAIGFLYAKNRSENNNSVYINLLDLPISL